MLEITRNTVITSEWWAEVVPHAFSVCRVRSEMLIATLAKHGYTQCSRGCGCVCGLYTLNMLITSLFFNFGFDLENTSVIPGTQKEIVTVEQTPGCLHADIQFYISCMLLCRAHCLCSVISLRNPLHLTAGIAEKLMKYSAWSELFIMTDQMKEVADSLNFTRKINLYKILSSFTAPGLCILCSLKSYGAWIVSFNTGEMNVNVK